ncbi:penicillin-binding protein 2 [Kocuria sp.]|uniref:peptidoglycan D,D-transpeptidase FtsI family protein n=1 Tax=Kocuria sp. TaxID=1871328 RepID=UPI0026472551|nr:penicillin-binding protein 2 [Kocuria sp.]MDN5631164.1 penicillin-binding protein 2 [Kocuria sp.]
MSPSTARRNRLLRPYSRMQVGIAVLLVLLLLVVGKLFWIQGLDPSGRAEAAAAQRTLVESIPAVRGEITDSRGAVLARTLQRYDITVDQTAVTSVDVPSTDGSTQTVTPTQAVYKIADALGMSDTDVKKALDGDKTFNYVARGVTPEQYNKLRELNLPYIYGQPTFQRSYPNGSLGGSVVGFLGGDSQALGGIEQTQDSALRGTDGERRFEISGDGVRIPVAPQEQKAAQNGSDVQLSLDSDVQFFAEQAVRERAKALKAEWGTAVVMDVKTGKVLALADTSSVDPNAPGEAKAEDLGVRAVTQSVEPGSTEKIATLAGALDRGIVTPSTQITVPSYLQIGSEKITDAFDHPAQNRTVAGIIGDSMNTGTVIMGSKMDKQARHDNLANFGVGQATGIELPGESTGILAPADQWDARQEYTVLFGQGVSQTPLRTASIFQAVANKGRQIEPRIVNSVTAADGTVSTPQSPEPKQVLSESAAQDTLDVMENVVTQGGAKEAAVPGYRVGGKTGTAEAPSDSGGYDGYTTSFVGVAPMEDPQYLVAVTMQRPQGDVHTVGVTSTFSTIMSQVLHHYNVAPSTTEGPKFEMQVPENIKRDVTPENALEQTWPEPGRDESQG